METPTDWAQFFTDYAAASRSDDVERVAGFYADGFVVAGPRGSSTYKNNAAFRKWLKQVFEFNQTSGMESLEVLSTEAAPISGEYTQVTVTWASRFRKTGDEPITFRITYFVEHIGAPKILGYISHEDQAEAMKAKGLL
jgi:ketosteroid isomerase-like protein